MKHGPTYSIFPTILAIAVFVLTACAPSPTPQPAFAESLRVSVDEPGLVRVTQTDLANSGITVSDSAGAHLSVIQHSKTVPVEIEKKGDSSSVLFYALPNQNAYSSTDVFWVSDKGDPSPKIQTRRVTGGLDSNPSASYSDTLRLAEKKLYSPDAIEGIHWFWQALTAPTSQTITTTVTAPADSDAHLDLSLAGVTNGSHKADISMNGASIGTAQWQGRASEQFKADVNNVRAGDNTLTLNLPDAGNNADVMYLDALTLNYARQFIAQSNKLEFGGTDHNYQVRGFTGNDIRLYDVTDPRAVQGLDGAQITQDSNGTFEIAFHDDLTSRRYLAMTSDAIGSPALLQPAASNALRSTDQQADYLIIAPRQFDEALMPLVKYRSDSGLRVKVVDIQDTYDAFSDGVQDPHALRDFLTYTREQWSKPAPRFVLLVGKASYDYHDYLNAPNKNLLPTMLVPTLHLGEAASDNWYIAAGENDSHPTMAIGRIPAKTVDEVKTAVAKTLAYEAQPQDADWRKRALFVTDDKEPEFDTSADALVQTLPPSIQPQKVYLSSLKGDLDSGRAKILQDWNAGTLLTAYIGHGSIDTWAEGPLLSGQEVQGLTNGERLSILLTPTCLDGFFYHPERDSLAEDALFNSKGGIVAGLVPTGLSLTEDQDILMKTIADELFVKRTSTLGEAVMNAKQKMDSTREGEREVIDTFGLLGDPALKWNPPP